MQNCPICKSKAIHLFMEGIYDSDSTNVIECNHCGLQFLEPMMTEQEEADYYQNYYQKQINRHFKSLELFDLQERSYQHYEQYRDIYLKLTENCETLLEIGSGTGGFIRFLHKNRPEITVTSIERCNENISFIKKCFQNVLVENDLSLLEGEKFDCIVAFGVFEHLRDSRTFLNELKVLLKFNGILALNIPNKRNALVFEYNLEEFKKFTYMKQHYFTFTELSLQYLSKQTGYSIKRFNYMQVWGLDNHLSWLRYRKPRDSSNIRSILSKKTLEAYDSDLISKKISDLMMVIMEPG